MFVIVFCGYVVVAVVRGFLYFVSVFSFVIIIVCFICCYFYGLYEIDEEFDVCWVIYFNKLDIDVWELRKGNWNIDVLYLYV